MGPYTRPSVTLDGLSPAVSALRRLLKFLSSFRKLAGERVKGMLKITPNQAGDLGSTSNSARHSLGLGLGPFLKAILFLVEYSVTSGSPVRPCFPGPRRIWEDHSESGLPCRL